MRICAGLWPAWPSQAGNITGLSFQTGELSGKWAEFLKEALPSISRVAVLTSGGAQIQRRTLGQAASTMGVYLHIFEVHGADEFGSVFAAVRTIQAEGLVILGSLLFTIHAPAARSTGGTTPVASDLLSQTLRRSWRAHGLWTERVGPQLGVATRCKSLWTRSLKAPSLLTCPWSSPRGSSWLSTSRPQSARPDHAASALPGGRSAPVDVCRLLLSLEPVFHCETDEIGKVIGIAGDQSQVVDHGNGRDLPIDKGRRTPLSGQPCPLLGVP